MTFDWYKIFNEADFLATGLLSRTYSQDLEDIGPKEVLVTKGNILSMTYDGVMLSVGLNGKNPFYFEGLAIFKNVAGDVWLGIEIEN